MILERPCAPLFTVSPSSISSLSDPIQGQACQGNQLGQAFGEQPTSVGSKLAHPAAALQ